jgi:hypothetical protein
LPRSIVPFTAAIDRAAFGQTVTTKHGCPLSGTMPASERPIKGYENGQEQDERNAWPRVWRTIGKDGGVVQGCSPRLRTMSAKVCMTVSIAALRFETNIWRDRRRSRNVRICCQCWVQRSGQREEPTMNLLQSKSLLQTKTPARVMFCNTTAPDADKKA